MVSVRTPSSRAASKVLPPRRLVIDVTTDCTGLRAKVRSFLIRLEQGLGETVHLGYYDVSRALDRSHLHRSTSKHGAESRGF